ncbi:IclR family transcriptional regulator [Tepidanaerobacter syntrophicus]|uniref:IclR family transcriptional regulator n=1 Tax=Tepidanaerobacter syntrophicus TaxID=224999 RepID=UPI001BD2DEB8
MDKEKNLLRSCLRTLEILEALSCGKELGVTEIGKYTNLHKSTVYRFLDTLEHKGYVTQNPETGKYKISFKILNLGFNLISNMDIRTVARPFMEDLARKTGETVYLTMIDAGQIIYIDKVNFTENLQTFHKVGDKNFVHCTASGKAQAAFLPEEEFDYIIQKWGLPKQTKNTITDIDILKKQLDKVKALGYAIDNRESEDDVMCVASPIFDYTGNVVASLSISGPITRINLEKINRDYSQLILKAAADISRELGCLNPRKYIRK